MRRRWTSCVNLIGMDWGEEGLGVVYMLESTRHRNRQRPFTDKTATTDRENALPISTA
jgi:hypothetical protein